MGHIPGWAIGWEYKSGSGVAHMGRAIGSRPIGIGYGVASFFLSYKPQFPTLSHKT